MIRFRMSASAPHGQYLHAACRTGRLAAIPNSCALPDSCAWLEAGNAHAKTNVSAVAQINFPITRNGVLVISTHSIFLLETARRRRRLSAVAARLGSLKAMQNCQD